MKRYFVTGALLILALCSAYSTEAKGGKGDKKKSGPGTFCYVISDGENNQNINAVKLVIDGDNVTGELKYITAGEPPAAGKLNGTIKDGIITADWTFIKQTNYYKVPVAFKMTKDAVFQKPSAVNADGQAYIPEGGEYSYEFPLVDCAYYPQ